MIARLQDNGRLRIDAMDGAKSGTDRLIHRRIRIAFRVMKRAATKRGGNRIRNVSEYNNHLVANGTYSVIRRGDERFAPVRGRPRSQLFLAAHAPAAAGRQNYADAAITICGGHLAS